MAFKAKATDTAATDYNKRYFWAISNLGNAIMEYGYVTADAPGAIETSGYFNNDELEFVLKPGDKICIWQVGAISDLRTVRDDIAAGFVDYNETFVVTSDGSGINVSPMAVVGSIEYSLP